MAKTKISSADLAWIFAEKLKAFEDCAPRISIAIVPDAKFGWSAIADKRSRASHPRCAKRIEAIQKELRGVYSLAND